MPPFTVYADPSDLLHLNMIWSIVLESEIQDVYTPAINLLVYCYLSLDTVNQSEESRAAKIQNLLTTCFDLLKPESNPTAHIVTRVT